MGGAVGGSIATGTTTVANGPAGRAVAGASADVVTVWLSSLAVLSTAAVVAAGIGAGTTPGPDWATGAVAKAGSDVRITVAPVAAPSLGPVWQRQLGGLLLAGLAQGADQFRTGRHDRVFMRLGLNQRAVDVEQTTIDQTGLRALVDRLDEELLENVDAPTSPGLGEHAAVGNIRIQIKAQEPEEVQADAELLHQFTLTWDVVEEEQQQQLDNHPRVQRDVTGATISVTDGGDDKGKV